jgi:hypothetical protein
MRIHDDQIDFEFFDEFQDFLNPVPVTDAGKNLDGFFLIAGHKETHLLLGLFLQIVVESLIFSESRIGDDFNDMEEVNSAFVFFARFVAVPRGVMCFLEKSVGTKI